MLPRLRFTLTRSLPFPPRDVYAWCTDYSSDDAALSGGLLKSRRVLERRGDSVRLETVVRFGQGEMRRIQQVRLDPARTRWEVDIVEGAGTGSHHAYTVEPANGGGSRLSIRFGYTDPSLRGQLAFWLKRRHVRASLERLWDSFAEAMGKDLLPAR